MREKEIVQAIVKLVQDCGESILNDKLLFRVMLDDSLNDTEKQIIEDRYSWRGFQLLCDLDFRVLSGIQI